MTEYEIYRAQADAGRAESLAATTSPFTIEVRFLGGLTDSQQGAFAAAADRWTTMIVGDLPAVIVDGELIDDVLILAQGVPIDGVGRILGQAGPTHIRPATAGPAAFLPVKGIMSFDTADLAAMEANGTLGDVITHEMGHVLGLGMTIWNLKELLDDADPNDPVFVGPAATQAYAELRGAANRRGVPVENTGGPGTARSHWREIVFNTELMTGLIAGAGNALSRVTVAGMGDLGYQVDLDAAEPYQLPDLLALAEAGVIKTHALMSADIDVMLPVIPQLVPPESLQTQPS